MEKKHTSIYPSIEENIEEKKDENQMVKIEEPDVVRENQTQIKQKDEKFHEITIKIPASCCTLL